MLHKLKILLGIGNLCGFLLITLAVIIGYIFCWIFFLFFFMCYLMQKDDGLYCMSVAGGKFRYGNGTFIYGETIICHWSRCVIYVDVER